MRYLTVQVSETVAMVKARLAGPRTTDAARPEQALNPTPDAECSVAPAGAPAKHSAWSNVFTKPAGKTKMAEKDGSAAPDLPSCQPVENNEHHPNKSATQGRPLHERLQHLMMQLQAGLHIPNLKSGKARTEPPLLRVALTVIGEGRVKVHVAPVGDEGLAQGNARTRSGQPAQGVRAKGVAQRLRTVLVCARF
jgi:hypothetical protein